MADEFTLQSTPYVFRPIGSSRVWADGSLATLGSGGVGAQSCVTMPSRAAPGLPHTCHRHFIRIPGTMADADTSSPAHRALRAWQMSAIPLHCDGGGEFPPLKHTGPALCTVTTAKLRPPLPPHPRLIISGYKPFGKSVVYQGLLASMGVMRCCQFPSKHVRNLNRCRLAVKLLCGSGRGGGYYRVLLLTLQRPHHSR